MNLDEQLLEILVCPQCKGEIELDREQSRILCNACRLAYPVRDDIPVMLIDEAETF